MLFVVSSLFEQPLFVVFSRTQGRLSHGYPLKHTVRFKGNRSNSYNYVDPGRPNVYNFKVT